MTSTKTYSFELSKHTDDVKIQIRKLEAINYKKLRWKWSQIFNQDCLKKNIIKCSIFFYWYSQLSFPHWIFPNLHFTIHLNNLNCINYTSNLLTWSCSWIWGGEQGWLYTWDCCSNDSICCISVDTRVSRCWSCLRNVKSVRNKTMKIKVTK